MGLKIKIAAVLVTIVFLISGISMLFLEYVQYRDEVALREAIRLEEERKRAEAEAEEQRKKDEAADLLALKIKYDVIHDYYNQRAVVEYNKKFGVINEGGEIVIDIIYDKIEDFTTAEYTKVKKDGNWGYISRNGNILVPIEYYYCGKPHENIVVVGKNGRYGYYDMNGNKVTGLLYDKVEDFGKTTSGHGKVILNQKYGLVNNKGEVVVPINNDYIDENAEFIGTWNRTEVHSAEGASLEINNQTANTFEFTLTANYYTKQGTITDMADIVSPTAAEYVFDGPANREVIRFERVDDYILITSNLSGNAGLEKGINVLGKYIIDDPVYKNAETMDTVFGNVKVRNQILAAIGEEIYEDIFLPCVNGGLYEIEDLNEKNSVIKGELYHFYIPTTEKAFKMVIARDTKYIYFQARSEDAYTYKTDDPDRQNRPISAVSFDEILD